MLLLAFVLIFLNAFFVLSEFALVKVRRSKLEEMVKDKVSNAKLALKMTNSIDTYLSACQIGITLASLALGWIGEPAVARLLKEPLSAYGFSTTAVHTISVVIAFSVITILHIVLGEQAPKLIAIAKSEKIVLWIARPLYYFWVLCLPAIKAFDFIASSVVRLFGIRAVKDSEVAHSEEEIKIIASESLKGGVLDSLETEIIKNAVEFGDTVAKEIMTPRKDLICLNKQKSYEENYKIMIDSKFTRFPYIDGSKDNVLGLIHIRDILQHSGEKNFDKIVRKIIIVPENSPISKILPMMNKERISAALVIDEYGGTAGLLTMEDIIEEIFGEINDEHDDKNLAYKKLDDKSYEFKGRFEIESVEELMEIAFDDETEQLTIGGYVFNLLGRLPVVGDVIEDENCIYEVLKMDGTTIGSVKVSLKDENKTQND
ncbi:MULTISPECIES: hemolysin family protein [unclassified Campylobacter]|uniref:hemolysin family protein n=1 Tax=unclassified Campylobacter TaxID=2593542 RepID=UPI0022E9BE73|nr:MULTISPECIES: hemolysin family protein [unclassified Campylobacter]MDA3056836.1 hemolysin family protein [Campylobacter sp. CN_NA1]MDA3066154.1 hemolysin family protein [Campylobacter sp. CN_NE4]MDA3069437.1 hemolysin family protein [Campylobacter sp. CN_NE3]MDA3083387.1 hemolysin family protein [Campylobacter sp. CN_EL2]MDA3084902.1 hemolysin family protein [Campylobacter sp. CN_NE1]